MSEHLFAYCAPYIFDEVDTHRSSLSTTKITNQCFGIFASHFVIVFMNALACIDCDSTYSAYTSPTHKKREKKKQKRIPIRIFVPAQFRSDCIKQQFILRVNTFIAFLSFAPYSNVSILMCRFYFHLKLAFFFSRAHSLSK